MTSYQNDRNGHGKCNKYHKLITIMTRPTVATSGLGLWNDNLARSGFLGVGNGMIHQADAADDLPCMSDKYSTHKIIEQTCGIVRYSQL